MPNYYVAIDDTDHVDDDGRNKGTGSKARALAHELLELVGGAHRGITRHQLLLDPAVRYTSHNSSACVALEVDGRSSEVIPTLVEASELYLPEIASPGSDVGLCVAESAQVGPEIVSFGWRAKDTVLTVEEAHAVAGAGRIHLAGLTGDRSGVIGALAAVGLRASGADGRFLELGDLRAALGEQPASVFIAAGVERFILRGDEVELSPEELIVVGQKHAQPVLLEGCATLLLDPESERGSWRAASREAVKQF